MSSRRPVVFLLVAGLLGAGAALVAAAPAPAAPETGPIATVLRTSPSVTVPRSRDDGMVFATGLGTFLGATDGALEFRTRRQPYSGPVTSTLTYGSGGDRKTIDLPAGLTRDVNSLTGFAQVTVRDAKGKRILRELQGLCPGENGPIRQDPKAPATWTYATQCIQHPFAKSALIGIQDGWAVPAGNGLFFKAPPGNYSYQLLVTPRYRAALGLTKAQATAEVQLKVRNSSEADIFSAAAGAHAAGVHSGHAMEDGKKVVATTLRAAARRPTPRAGDAKRAVDGGLAPNLVALPAYQLGLSRSKGKTYLDFSATVYNNGTSPLLVDGFRRPGTRLMDAYQYFFDSDGTQTGSAPAGTLQWDPRKGHHHWHFTAFASYFLLDADRKNPVRSGKEAFCLVSTDQIETTLPKANLSPASTTLQGACGAEDALGTRQVIDVGWGDTYSQYLPGQSFDVTTVPNGTYYVRVLANPDGKLVEQTRADNGSLRRVRLGGTPGGRRTLKVTPYQGVTE